MGQQTNNGRNRFQRGLGCFECECCGRKTRDTGVQNLTPTCSDCYELAGIYNCLQDGESVTEYADEIRWRTGNITDKGGNLDSDARELLAAIGEGGAA